MYFSPENMPQAGNYYALGLLPRNPIENKARRKMQNIPL